MRRLRSNAESLAQGGVRLAMSWSRRVEVAGPRECCLNPDTKAGEERCRSVDWGGEGLGLGAAAAAAADTRVAGLLLENFFVRNNPAILPRSLLLIDDAVAFYYDLKYVLCRVPPRVGDGRKLDFVIVGHAFLVVVTRLGRSGFGFHPGTCMYSLYKKVAC